MEHKKHSPLSILKIVCGIAFGFWLMMGAPTGWIYDLGVGTGTGADAGSVCLRRTYSGRCGGQSQIKRKATACRRSFICVK